MQRRLLLPLSLLVSSAAALPAQGTLYHLDGGGVSEMFGSAVAGIGDANGDCIPDFVVGMPGADSNGVDAGRVSLYSGADGTQLRQWNGPNAGDAFGTAVAAAGDANGDGRADILVGSPGMDFTGPGAGAAWLLSGANGRVLRVWNGSAAGDAFGSAVGGAGHVDRNGFADVIVGAPGGNYARVFDGSTGNQLLQISPAAAPADAVGASVDGVGDIDGDGFGEVVIGAPGDDSNGADAGLVLLVSGRDGSILQSFQGDDAGDALGTSVRGAGDVDADGTPDVVAGAPGDDNKGVDSGSARVFSGSGSTLYTFDGDFDGDAFGTAVAGTDINSDGFADIVAGAPGNDWGGSNAGAARVLSGSDGTILATWRGEAVDDGFGSAVDGAGDASGDGYADVIAGAPGDDDGGAEAGSATVFARAPFDTLALTQTLTPAASPGLFGNDNEFVGDVDNDGVGDYAIGAVSDLGAQGVVRVFSGADHSLIHAFTGGNNNIFFGPTIGAAGDVNGDGHADVLTGAQHWDSGSGFNGRATLRSGADGTVIHQWFGNQNNSHLGSALGSLGDIDGDTVPDVYVGSLKQDPGTAPAAGSVRAYSGATGLMIWEVFGSVRGEWFSTDGEDLGDIDGDGIRDFVTGAPQPATGPPALPGYAVVLSGVDGSQIYRFDGLNLGDLFGGSSSRAGDVNGDGVMDILVGGKDHDPQGKTSAGMARVFSGADGSVLHHLEGEFAGDAFGQFVNDAGDVNGDGFDDFLVGAAGYDPGGVIAAGRAYLFSGLDGSVLQTLDGTIIGQQFGRALSGIGDANGDGYADINIGAPTDPTAGPQSGAAYAYESTVESDPGSVTLFGASCTTVYGWLPLLTVTGRPAIGDTYTVHLNPLINEGNPTALLRIGNSNTSLGGKGRLPWFFETAVGCTLYTNATTIVPVVPSLAGVSIPQSVPNNASLIGTMVYCQFLVNDPRKNLLGKVLSNAAKIKIGQ